ncbi:MAG TPA: serine/threonine-protein kinase [Gemmataceae bacterium]|nr:serine/threonine-protein kinase [Gemmataceae bacterium]
MTESVKTESTGEEERLAHALISRGLITRDEYKQCRGDGGGSQAFLSRLVKAGCLTVRQAQRALQDLQVLVEQQIPGYQLLQKVGQGSCGTVYKAKQLSMDRLVAIKVVVGKSKAEPAFLERFIREAQLAAKLSHNNVVQAIDVGTAGRLHYFVMEYIEGTTIKDELEKGKVYSEREGLEIVLQIAQALEQAHRRGLIHRDIKPANIILTREGVAKLADLGLARETSDRELARAEKGIAVGTPYYISPEQIRAREDIDSRADIYSLGATFYHMVTGNPPFPGPGIDNVLRAHLQQELVPPDHVNTALSSGLGEVVEFMMAKDREQRYQTPGDLIVDLECLLNGEAPRLARQRMAEALAKLEEGEEAEEEHRLVPEGVPWSWVIGLGVALGISLLLNLIQLLR